MERIDPLLKWLADTGDEAASALCEKHGTSVGYMRQVGYGNKRPSAQKAMVFEHITGISRKVFRPDDWHLIWPELDSEAA